jgi:DeoR/GlpR family transcriptional regulator of sugar metabolism
MDPITDDLPTFADERQNRITELVAARGKVLTSQLTALFNVSEPTLRKDLTVLEQRGLLRRTHGGAISVRPPREQDLEARSTVHFEAKQAIGTACLTELSDGDSVFLDSGTTVQLVARELARAGRRLKVVTNAPKVAAEVATSTACTHVLLGGQYRAIGGSLTGPLTLQNLELFTINAAVIGVSGLTDDGLTVSDLAEAQLKNAVIARAQKVIVPVDGSKVGVVDFTRVCGLEQVDVVVTDRPNAALEAMCDSRGIKVVNANRS